MDVRQKVETIMSEGSMKSHVPTLNTLKNLMKEVKKVKIILEGIVEDEANLFSLT